LNGRKTRIKVVYTVYSASFNHREGKQFTTVRATTTEPENEA
jgi:hypothetical protein